MGETVGYGIAAVWCTVWVYVAVRWRHYLVQLTLRWERPVRPPLPLPLHWLLVWPSFASPRRAMGLLISVVVLASAIAAIMWAGFIGGLYQIITTHR